jgi:NADPH:quinone reductase-like Zn-dependent oxidoreductase
VAGARRDPRSFGTAWGTLAELGLSKGQSLLVHGGTSSVGMATSTIAGESGVTVLATTRQERKLHALEAAGVDHPIVADGEVPPAVRTIVSDGVDGLCELIGPNAMTEALRAVRSGGRACITGFLEGDRETGPAEAEAERLGVELRRFGSGVIDRDGYQGVFQELVRGVEDGRYEANLDRTFPMSEIAEAHRYMEGNRAAGKVVVVPPEE